MRFVSANISGFSKYGNAREIVKMMKEAGFTAYDASMGTNGVLDWMLYADDWQEKAQEFRKYADELGIRCNQAHAPFSSARKGDEKYNEWMFPRLIRAIEVSGILGAKVCVVHPCNDWNAEENAAFYQKLEPVAKKAGVKIGVENMWNWDQGSPHATKAACSHHEDFKAHLDLLNPEVFTACLDIGHAEMQGLETSAVEMIQTLQHNLGALHIQDVDKTHDNHQLPFTQAIDFEKVMGALKAADYQGDITFETTYGMRATPKELQPALARYLFAIGNYFKDCLEKR
jgi:sugar phosphate isomerase/epimerase